MIDLPSTLLRWHLRLCYAAHCMSLFESGGPSLACLLRSTGRAGVVTDCCIQPKIGEGSVLFGALSGMDLVCDGIKRFHQRSEPQASLQPPSCKMRARVIAPMLAHKCRKTPRGGALVMSLSGLRSSEEAFSQRDVG